MCLKNNFLLLIHTSFVWAVPSQHLQDRRQQSTATRIPTVYLCGDSTMAEAGGGSGTQGWGHYLQYSFASSVAVINSEAIAGRSARSFTREGRFDTVIGQVQSGDWVVIEFGHNDGGSLTTDNGRSDCFGDGTQTCQTTYK